MSARTGDDALRRVLEAASRDSETLRLLQTDPEALAKRYELSPEVLEALKHTDVLLSLRPLRRKELTFKTGTTITAGRVGEELTFETGTTITAGGTTITFDTGSTITAGIRGLLEGIAAESKTLQLLRTDPEALIEELGIDPSQLDRLKDARAGVVMRGRSITFQTGTTIEV
jgi:hypothetical protein